MEISIFLTIGGAAITFFITGVSLQPLSAMHFGSAFICIIGIELDATPNGLRAGILPA